MRNWKYLIAAAAIGLAAFLLYRTLSRYSLDQLVEAVSAVPVPRLLGAAGFAAASYLCLTCFDYLALRYVGKPVPLRDIALTSFISYAFTNTLGAAGPDNFAVLALSGAQDIALNGPGTTNGNVGVTSGKLSLDGSNGPSVNGNVLLGAGASVTHPNLVTGNVFTNQNLAQANTDAHNAATTFSGLAATSGITSIKGTTTINGGAGVNVVNVSGISLGNGQTLTFPAA